ncbi:beta-eliminating lyase-related protein [Lysobacter sp. Root494]|uniref:threonine aldolase family protein n=1 Tax=Lysobacter sp. Root494 TaxID=1736549 RepID=UPI0009EB1BFB|nr:beta-eliminating lyase-related protein [Lysobacter sp. Root494]
MDRRHFLATTALAASASLLPAVASTTTAAAPSPGMDMFKRVNFGTDGLGLNAREYATLLHEAVTARPFPADFYSNGGVIEEIEKAFAECLGKQAAMFVPTGTLANHIAIRKLAGNDRRVLVQAESHLYNDSGDCAEVLSGLNLIPLAAGGRMPMLDEVKQWVERSAHGRVEMKVGAISIESPIRRLDHQMVPFAELQRVSAYAREQGIRLHLDGARLFNLPQHSGRSVRDYAALFDTVYVSLWKHFNGSTGAILAGDASFIEGLYHTRRMFGGSLPRAWPNVALVPRYLEHYAEDYARAWQSTERLIALLEADGRFRVRRIPDGTSRFFLGVAGVAPDVFSQRIASANVYLPQAIPDTGEFPIDVNATILRMTPDALARIFIGAIG